MKIELLKILRCPETRQRLTLEGAESIAGEVVSGQLVSEDGSHRHPIRNGIPRFVPRSNYADNFGMQWNMFRQTQLDSFSGKSISAERFWKSTGWKPGELAGQWVLDVGCGAGRFAEVALGAGARVVSLDYSGAVDACYANLKQHANLDVVQGNIYSLPFDQGWFSYVYSLGVLQHTPDVGKAFAALPPMLREGGKLCVDYYAKSWRSRLLPKYWLRPITRRMSKPDLFRFLQTAVPLLLPISNAVGTIPAIGGTLKRLIPVANHRGNLPLTDQQHLEWALLDTFDWLSPQFDNPQTAETARQWFEAANLKQIAVFKEGHLIGRGVK